MFLRRAVLRSSSFITANRGALSAKCALTRNPMSRPSPDVQRCQTFAHPSTRQLSTTTRLLHGDKGKASASAPTYTVTFVTNEGEEIRCEAHEGESVLDVAHRNDVDLEGACESSLACSTCHVIVEDPAYFDRIPEASDEENDMLDLAFGLTETSRLGCQVTMGRELQGLRVRIPSATRNMAVDGYKPKPH